MVNFTTRYGEDQLTFNYDNSRFDSNVLKRDLILRFGIEEGMEPFLMDSSQGRVINLSDIPSKVSLESMQKKSFEIFIRKVQITSNRGGYVNTENSGEEHADRRSLTNTLQSKDWPGNHLPSCNLAAVRVVPDINEFMKTVFKSTKRIMIIFILKKSDWAVFNSMNIKEEDHRDIGREAITQIYL